MWNTPSRIAITPRISGCSKRPRASRSNDSIPEIPSAASKSAFGTVPNVNPSNRFIPANSVFSSVKFWRVLSAIPSDRARRFISPVPAMGKLPATFIFSSPPGTTSASKRTLSLPKDISPVALSNPTPDILPFASANSPKTSGSVRVPAKTISPLRTPPTPEIPTRNAQGRKSRSFNNTSTVA